MSRFPEDPVKAIPHRPPILCIDRILEVGEKHALAARVVVPGGGVDRGEFWEPGLVEGLAQTAGVLNAYDEWLSGRPHRPGMLVGIRRCRIFRRARVGERIVFRVDLIRRISPLTLMRCEARVGEEVLAAGEMKFYVETGE